MTEEGRGEKKMRRTALGNSLLSVYWKSGNSKLFRWMRHCDINEYKFPSSFSTDPLPISLTCRAQGKLFCLIPTLNSARLCYCVITTQHWQQSDAHMTADKIQVGLLRRYYAVCCVSRYRVCQCVQWPSCFGGTCGCLYGQPKYSKDSYLVVRDDFWLSWTTRQPLLQTLSI